MQEVSAIDLPLYQFRYLKFGLNELSRSRRVTSENEKRAPLS